MIVVGQGKEDRGQRSIKNYSKLIEENQKAVERDFIKQEENFRKRLAMRKNGAKILTALQPEWVNESSINSTSMIKANISPEQSVELNASDINFGSLLLLILRF